MDDPSACPYLYTDGLSDELSFFAQARPIDGWSVSSINRANIVSVFCRCSLTSVQVWVEIASRVQACLAKERNREILTVSMSPRCPQSPLQHQIFPVLDGEFVLTCSVSDLFYTIVLLACGFTQPVNQFNKQSLFSMSMASTFTIRSIVHN